MSWKEIGNKAERLKRKFADAGEKRNPPVYSTFHFMDWVDGRHIDEKVEAIDREEAIGIMNEKYPNHDFIYVCELS
jgi:hypothetical protein